MRRRERRALRVVAPLAMALLAAGCDRGSERPTRGAGESEPAPSRILLSMKGPGGGNPFWAAMEEGARAAAAARGADLVVLAPPTEADVEIQIAQIEAQVAKGIDALVVAPTDVAGLGPTFDAVAAKGIPVLFVDTDALWRGRATFVGTDNRAGGRLAGRRLCETLSAGSKVGLVTGVMSHQTHIDRIAGAKEALAECGLEVVAEAAANSDRALAQNVMEDMMVRHPDLAAVFASSDLMALGALEALRTAGRIGAVAVVGFDAIPEAVAAVEAGEMSATVAQNPRAMGERAIAAAADVLAGRDVEPRIDTGTLLVTRRAR